LKKFRFPVQSGVHDLYFTYSSPALKNSQQSGMQFDWFYFTKTLPGKGKEGYDSVAKWAWELATKDGGAYHAGHAGKSGRYVPPYVCI
jgi:hypothetical protein